MIQRSLRREKASHGSLESGPPKHPTLALRLVLSNLRGQARSRVLDLGSAVGANVSFLTRYHCKLYIADLFHSLRTDRDGLSWDSEALDRNLTENLPHAENEGFDLVLAWDLLNYLDRSELQILGQHLSHLLNPKGLLFAMLSTRKQIPDQPTSFRILNRDTLAYENPSKLERPCPLYKEPDLGRLMSAFEVETSFLLRHGIQEYVLALRQG